MIGLFRAELLRAWSRRVVRVLAVAVAVSIVVSMGIATYNGLRNSADTQYRQALASCLRGEFTGGNVPPPFKNLAAYCADQVRPENFVSNELRWSGVPDVLVSGTSSIVVLLGVLLGATLAGADWTAGTMGTLLTWEPRRIRVHLVRVLVTVAVVLVFTIFVQVLLIAVFRIAVAIAGSAQGTPKGMPRHLIEIVARVAVVAALFGVVAHAIATLGRSTVAALGVIFGYLIVVEGFVAGLWTAIQPRLLIRAAEVVISQQPLLGRAVITSDKSGNVFVQSQEVLLSVSRGWVVLGVWVVGLTALAVLVFRARDVS